MKNLLLLLSCLWCFSCTTTTVVEAPKEEETTLGTITFRLDGKLNTLTGKAVVLFNGSSIARIAIAGKNAINESISIIGQDNSYTLGFNSSTGTFSYSLCPSSAFVTSPTLTTDIVNTGAKTIKGTFSGQVCNQPNKASSITEGVFFLQYD